MVDFALSKSFAIKEQGVANSQPITLDQFLKQSGLVGSGGQAKIVIQSGDVTLNGVVETRRGKKLSAGDIVRFAGRAIQVPPDEDATSA